MPQLLLLLNCIISTLIIVHGVWWAMEKVVSQRTCDNRGGVILVVFHLVRKERALQKRRLIVNYVNLNISQTQNITFLQACLVRGYWHCHVPVGTATQRHAPPLRSRAKNEVCSYCRFSVEVAAEQWGLSLVLLLAVEFRASRLRSSSRAEKWTETLPVTSRWFEPILHAAAKEENQTWDLQLG